MCKKDVGKAGPREIDPKRCSVIGSKVSVVMFVGVWSSSCLRSENLSRRFYGLVRF